mgnify:CR=1 FL=1
MLLSDEQILIRDTARAFAQEQVAPHVRAWEAAGEIPRPLLAEMGRLGFMGMCVPAEWGGSGADMVSYVAGAGGDRGGRWRAVHRDERQQLARLRRASGLRLDRAEGALAEAAGARRGAGRLLPDRAAGRLRRLEPQDARRARAATAGC